MNMADYTNYFTLSEGLNEIGLDAPAPTLKDGGEYSETDLLSALEEILKCINTLDDYDKLVDILEEMRDRITLYFLYIFYQALASVEERVWGSAGMHPPIREYVDDNLDLLLEKYDAFVYELEKALVQWSKDKGFFQDPEKYEFIRRRNDIYARYSVLAGEIISYGNS